MKTLNTLISFSTKSLCLLTSPPTGRAQNKFILILILITEQLEGDCNLEQQKNNNKITIKDNSKYHLVRTDAANLTTFDEYFPRNCVMCTRRSTPPSLSNDLW